MTFKTVLRLLSAGAVVIVIVGGYLAYPTIYWSVVAYMNADKTVSASQHGVAIQGYDTVAYFTEGKPKKGLPEYEAVWQDAKWHFSNKKHKELFISNPERYAPQFRGFCALGISIGKKWDPDPIAWSIVDGKLYLNYDDIGRKKFIESSKDKIAKAKGNWDSNL